MTYDDTTMAIAVLFLLVCIAYFGWFFGRLHEAEVQYEQEQLDEAAYQWAAANNRLPTVTKYVDVETGEVLN